MELPCTEVEIDAFLAAFEAGTLPKVEPVERAAFAALAVKHFVTQRDIFSRYYEFDLVASTDARRRWVPPTLQPLD